MGAVSFLMGSNGRNRMLERNLIFTSAMGFVLAFVPPASAKSENSATGIGNTGTPPGQALGSPAKSSAPGQAKKTLECDPGD